MKLVRKSARLLALLLLPAAALLLILLVPGAVLLGAATLVSFKATAQVSWDYEASFTGLTSNTASQNSFSYTANLTNGTGASGTGNQLYVVQTTVAGGANTTITFSAGLTDVLGLSLAFLRIKFLFVSLLTTTTASSVAIGNATHPLPITNTGTATIQINNGGMFLTGDIGATGIAVGVGATDALKILNNDGTNTATLQICAVGSTA